MAYPLLCSCAQGYAVEFCSFSSVAALAATAARLAAPTRAREFEEQVRASSPNATASPDSSRSLC